MGKNMTVKNWQCQDCGKNYPKTTNGFCSSCGGLVLPVDSVTVTDTENILPPMPYQIPKGQCGLGILAFDFSGSMNEAAFPEKDLPQQKIDLIAQAFDTAMKKLSNIANAENAYVAVIGFAAKAKILKFMKASMIDHTHDWAAWIYKQQLNLLETEGDGTNITEALKLAREIYDCALKGDLSKFGFNDFAPLHHDIAIGDDVFSIPNIRVFVYSDGKHSIGEFINYFENATLIPRAPNVNGLICAYFGSVEDEGFESLYQIAGTCPRHGIKGIIHITTPEMYPYIRQLFHMASAASGFCAQCAKEARFGE